MKTNYDDLRIAQYISLNLIPNASNQEITTGDSVNAEKWRYNDGIHLLSHRQSIVFSGLPSADRVFFERLRPPIGSVFDTYALQERVFLILTSARPPKEGTFCGAIEIHKGDFFRGGALPTTAVRGIFWMDAAAVGRYVRSPTRGDRRPTSLGVTPSRRSAKNRCYYARYLPTATARRSLRRNKTWGQPRANGDASSDSL